MQQDSLIATNQDTTQKTKRKSEAKRRGQGQPRKGGQRGPSMHAPVAKDVNDGSLLYEDE